MCEPEGNKLVHKFNIISCVRARVHVCLVGGYQGTDKEAGKVALEGGLEGQQGPGGVPPREGEQGASTQSQRV